MNQAYLSLIGSMMIILVAQTSFNLVKSTYYLFRLKQMDRTLQVNLADLFMMTFLFINAIILQLVATEVYTPKEITEFVELIRLAIFYILNTMNTLLSVATEPASIDLLNGLARASLISIPFMLLLTVNEMAKSTTHNLGRL